MMSPFSNLSQVYSILVQEEEQRQMKVSSSFDGGYLWLLRGVLPRVSRASLGFSPNRRERDLSGSTITARSLGTLLTDAIEFTVSLATSSLLSQDSIEMPTMCGKDEDLKNENSVPLTLRGLNINLSSFCNFSKV